MKLVSISVSWVSFILFLQRLSSLIFATAICLHKKSGIKKFVRNRDAHPDDQTTAEL